MEQLFFGFGYILAIIGILIYKKTSKSENFLAWLIISIILMMCYHSMVSCLLMIINMKFDILVYGIMDFLLGALTIIKSWRIKKYQNYKIKLNYIIVFFVIVIVGSYLAYKEFSINLNIAYIMSDPAVHFRNAMDMINNGTVSSMCFASTNNALFISMFIPVVENTVNLYRAFILSDIVMLMLSGGVIYILIERYMNKRVVMFIGLLLVGLYMGGYPLNNMLFGFNYLGMCVSLICVLIYFLERFYNLEITDKLAFPILSMFFLSVSLCYSLFSPAVWIIGAFIIAKRIKRDGKLLSLNTVIVFLTIFLIPTILTIKFCFIDFFVSNGVNFTTQVNAEGGIYINFVSNFILFLPFVVLSIYICVKKKENTALSFFIIGWSIYIVISHLLRINNIMSTYYCFKSYYVWWLLCIAMVIPSISNVTWNYKRIIAILASIVVLASITFIVPIDKPEFKNNPLLDIYSYNFSYLNRTRTFDEYSIDLYRYINANLKDTTDQVIPFIMSFGNYGRTYWYEAMLGYDISEFSSLNFDTSEIIQRLKDEKIEYVGFFYYDEEYLKYEEFLSHQKKVFETPSGAIYKLV